MATTTSNDFYRNPRLTTIAYAAGILLFFLPFIEIKCSGTSVAQLSGKDMVFGSAPSLGNGMEDFGKAFGNNDSIKTASKTEDKGRVYVTAIIALLLGIGGLFLSLSKTNKNYTAMMIAGIAGAILLIVLIIQVKGDINSEMKTQTGNSDALNDQFSGMMKVSVAITAWFVICVLSYLAAAFFSYKQKGMSAVHEIPSVRAPQLDLQNPGDQSDFPAAPTGDKDLG